MLFLHRKVWTVAARVAQTRASDPATLGTLLLPTVFIPNCLISVTIILISRVEFRTEIISEMLFYGLKRLVIRLSRKGRFHKLELSRYDDGLRAGRPRDRTSIPCKGHRCSLLYNLRTGSGAHSDWADAGFLPCQFLFHLCSILIYYPGLVQESH
jgi:hypothetical protein